MFNVQWPIPQGITPEMSGKDTAAPYLNVRRLPAPPTSPYLPLTSTSAPYLPLPLLTSP